MFHGQMDGQVQKRKREDRGSSSRPSNIVHPTSYLHTQNAIITHSFHFHNYFYRFISSSLHLIYISVVDLCGSDRMSRLLAYLRHLLLLPSVLNGMWVLPTLRPSIFCFGFSTRSLAVSRQRFGLPNAHQKHGFHRSAVTCFSQWDDILDEIEGLLDVVESRNASSFEAARDGDRISPWSTLDLKDLSIRENKPSPVEEKNIAGRRVYIKRDDLLRLHGSQISGNKARKLLAMNEVPAHEFPNCLVSYGGPQSNSMLALAALVNYKNREAFKNNKQQDSSNDDAEKDETADYPLKRFVYYTKKLPRFLRNQPSGNLFRAKSLGMELVELSQDDYANWFGGDYGGSPTPPFGLDPPLQGDSLWVSCAQSTIAAEYDQFGPSLT